jgi:hypothetical protein
MIFFILSCSSGFNIYVQLFFDQALTNKMYNLNMFPTIAAITIAVAWGGAAIYYYAINSVKFDRWYHWLAVMGVVAVLAPVACFIYNDAVFEGYVGAKVQFEMQTILFAALLYVVASFSMRWWSTNCRHTPIPQ